MSAHERIPAARRAAFDKAMGEIIAAEPWYKRVLLRFLMAL